MSVRSSSSQRWRVYERKLKRWVRGRFPPVAVFANCQGVLRASAVAFRSRSEQPIIVTPIRARGHVVQVTMSGTTHAERHPDEIVL